MTRTKAWYINDYYEKYFNQLCNSGLNKKGSGWFHKNIEKNWSDNVNIVKILEVGAGEGAHLDYVNFDKFQNNVQYTLIDLRPVKKNLLLLNSASFKIDSVIGSVENLPFEDESFDRVISTCLFHHLNDPLKAFSEIRRVLRVGGEFSVGMPTDPGMLNRLIKNLITYRRARKLNLINIRFVYALEHQNHIGSLLELFKEVFKNDSTQIKYFPFGFKSWNLNLQVVAYAKKRSSVLRETH